MAVRLIKLEHCEFGIVSRRDAFIPKDPIQIVNTVQPANYEPFQIQLRRDAQVKRHIQRVVMRFEGFRKRAARDRMQDGRFDFEVVPVVEKSSELADDDAALDEYLTHLTIHDQVDVALPIADFDVLQPVPFFRQRQETFRQIYQLIRQDGQLSSLRAEQPSFDSDEIPDVEKLVELEIALRELIFFSVDLQLPFAVGQRDEARFSKWPVRQNSSRNADLVLSLFQFLGGLRRELLRGFGKRVRETVVRRVRITPQRLDLLQLLNADLFE